MSDDVRPDMDPLGLGYCSPECPLAKVSTGSGSTKCLPMNRTTHRVYKNISVAHLCEPWAVPEITRLTAELNEAVNATGVIGQHTQCPEAPDEVECPSCHRNGVSRGWRVVSDDNDELSNDNKPHDPARDWYDFEPPEDLEPVYATLHFYYNDPDSMHRLRECLDAPKWKSAVWDFDQWLRNEIKHHGAGPDFDTIRERLHVLFDEQGIDIWEDGC